MNLLPFFGNKYIYLLFRLTLGIIFIWASIGKIINPGDFAEAVNNYKILPGYTINFFALILPVLELLCAISLLIGFRTKSSALILSIVLLIFIIAISSAIVRGLDINCGCFKTNPAESSKVSYSLLWRDILMLLMCIHLMVHTSDFLTFSSFKQKSNLLDNQGY